MRITDWSAASVALRRPSRVWTGLAFFAIYFVWGTTYLGIRFAVETIPPLLAAGLRHTIAGLILMAVAWSRGFRSKREHWIAGAVLGVLWFLVGHGTLHWAERYVSSGLAALLVATEPLFILVIGAGIGQQRINWQNGLGLVLGLAGVAILTLQELTTVSMATWGVMVVAFAAYTWLLQHCSPTIVATHTFVNPLVAVLAGWLWGLEAMSWRVIVAAVVVLAAIALIERGDRRGEVQAEAVQATREGARDVAAVP